MVDTVSIMHFIRMQDHRLPGKRPPPIAAIVERLDPGSGHRDSIGIMAMRRKRTPVKLRFNQLNPGTLQSDMPIFQIRLHPIYIVP